MVPVVAKNDGTAERESAFSRRNLHPSFAISSRLSGKITM
jgi:hypothetical protein